MTLRIDIKAFSREIKELREGWEDWSDTFDSYREYLACELKNRTHLWRPARPRTIDDVRAEMVTASVAAYTAGATDEQISTILSLLDEQGDFREVGYSRLTKSAASMLISDLQRGR